MEQNRFLNEKVGQGLRVVPKPGGICFCSRRVGVYNYFGKGIGQAVVQNPEVYVFAVRGWLGRAGRRDFRGFVDCSYGMFDA